MTIDYILDNPRRLTSHLFSDIQTVVMLIMLLTLIILQYVVFLASSIHRKEAIAAAGSISTLVGIGYFQTFSTRTAGFAMMDFRALSEGLILVYALMMYMAAYPFVATMKESENLRRRRTKMHKDAVGSQENVDASLASDPFSDPTEYPTVNKLMMHQPIQDAVPGSSASAAAPRMTSEDTNISVTKLNSASTATSSTTSLILQSGSAPSADTTQLQLSSTAAAVHGDNNINALAAAKDAEIDRDNSGNSGKGSERLNNSILVPAGNSSSSKNRNEVQFASFATEELKSDDLESGQDKTSVKAQHATHDETTTTEEAIYLTRKNSGSSVNGGDVISAKRRDSLRKQASSGSNKLVPGNISIKREKSGVKLLQRHAGWLMNVTNDDRGERSLQRTGSFKATPEQSGTATNVSLRKVDPSVDAPDVSGNDDVDEQIERRFARQYLLRHTFFLVLALHILAFSEENLMRDPSKKVNLWYIAFEMISAYGTVGLSFGIPGEAYSLCGAMSTLGKLILMCIMILGKHRGLPGPEDEVIDFYFWEFRMANRLESINSNNPIARAKRRSMYVLENVKK